MVGGRRRQYLVSGRGEGSDNNNDLLDHNRFDLLQVGHSFFMHILTVLLSAVRCDDLVVEVKESKLDWCVERH